MRLWNGTTALVLCALASAPAAAQLVDDAPLKRFEESSSDDPFVDALLLRRAWEVVAASSTSWSAFAPASGR